MPTPPLKMAMVGGGRDAFIGAVHRMAACLDHEAVFTAGALSSTPEKAIASGADLGLAPDRNYDSWRQMLERETARPAADRIDFVSIVTPNHAHFEIANAFIEAGIPVVCDKPLTVTSDQAHDLVRAAHANNAIVAVTYNYSGYPMVKQAREMVASGELGDIRKVIVEYNQGWLAKKLEDEQLKQAEWRTDPARAGAGGAIGDIGSHAEQLVSYVTALEIDSLLADLTAFVPGRRLDDDANVLLRFTNGAKGILTASQICVGNENDLRLRVWGAKAGLEWRQEEPNHLLFKPLGEPQRTYRRGNDYLSEPAQTNTRLPFGHPEAFIEAFANVYRAVFNAIRDEDNADNTNAPTRHDYPSVAEGARGVRFIETVVASSNEGATWRQLPSPPSLPGRG